MAVITGNETVYVGPRVLLEGFSPEAYALLREACTGDNPQWFQWEALARVKPWMKRKGTNPHPKKIHTFELGPGGSMFVLRGWRARILERFPLAQVVDLRVAPKASVPFNWVHPYIAEPDDYQLTAFERIRDEENVVIEMPTGAGKTVTAMWTAHKLGLKTLFLVNTDVLVEQTMDEVRQALGIEPGIIKGDKTDLRDFTVGSLQSLATGRVEDHLKDFGLIFMDECHLAAAETFQYVLSMFYARYVVGLSGTPDDRSDKLGWMIYQGIGPKGFAITSRELVARGRIMGVHINPIMSRAYRPSREFDPMERGEHLKELCECQARNDEICDNLEALVRAGHNVAFFTEPIDHAHLIHQEMTRRLPGINPVLYYGTMTPASAKKAAYAQVKANASPLTITTYKSAGTGLDVKNWTDVYLGIPMKAPDKIKQTIGRGRRVMLGKTRMVVHDHVDELDVTLLKKYASRQRTYATL